MCNPCVLIFKRLGVFGSLRFKQCKPHEKLKFNTMKKFIGLSALAVLGAMSMQSVSTPGTSPDAQRNVRHDLRNQSRESKPLNVQPIVFNKIRGEASKAYSKLNYRNTGIDPKTYGMFYVKARTHKRTNV